MSLSYPLLSIDFIKVFKKGKERFCVGKEWVSRESREKRNGRGRRKKIKGQQDILDVKTGGRK